MAAVTWTDRRLELDGMHVQGLQANAFGVRGLILTLRALLESVDADEIIIRGAVRTSGANPGHRPRDIRIARKIQPAA
jgi:hypothetical protein